MSRIASAHEPPLVDTPRPPPRRRAIVSVMAAVYVLVQGVLPLFILARPSPGPHDFSWDMFSHRLTCTKIDATARVRGGSWTTIRLSSDFTSFAQFSRVLSKERLDSYGHYLCEKIRSKENGSIELRLEVECQAERHGPAVAIADRDRDYCEGTP